MGAAGQVFFPVFSIGQTKLVIVLLLLLLVAVSAIGLTYASKLLRFLHPDIHASLDNRIRDALLTEGLLQKIYDGNVPSMTRGYIAFLELIDGLVDRLENAGIVRPECWLPKGSNSTGWRAADVEMALFAWAGRSLRKPRRAKRKRRRRDQITDPSPQVFLGGGMQTIASYENLLATERSLNMARYTTFRPSNIGVDWMW